MNNTSESNWRSELKAAERYDNIEKLRKSIEAKALGSTDNWQSIAFAAETDAYNSSESREIYEAACKTIIGGSSPSEEPQSTDNPPPNHGIAIGQYTGCHYIASGLVSEVYRTTTVALKVITETRNLEPHNPLREVKILSQISHESIIRLISTFKDSSGRLVLVFPFMPLTLAKVLESGPVPTSVTKSCFHELFSALKYLHAEGIIHRDIKPSNTLLASPTGPAYLSDFGTIWDSTLSLVDEPANHKILEVGTSCYRAPETLFGNRSYDTSLDMWAAGTMLVECLRSPPETLFVSPDTSEDGNQLGLILNIFMTIGTPTKETWPEAEGFSTPPFEWYQKFPGKSWEELLEGVDKDGRDLVEKLVVFESGKRFSASEALEHPFFNE